MNRDGPLLLAIETSCDETAAAVVGGGARVLSSVVSSQAEVHARFGGVVPELASRAHVELVIPVVARALVEAGVDFGDLDAVAACHGPGLAGALLVGVCAAKSIALATGIPYVGVHHHEAHIYAAIIAEPSLEPPFVTLVASGGHTLLIAAYGHGEYRLLGRTVDDAAGEAFDKVARHLGLGYPGGPAIEAAAAAGDPSAIHFPRPMLDDGFAFSFAGLKTAVVRHCRENPDAAIADVAASFQAAVVDVLVTKLMRAAEATGFPTVVIGGGVAANTVLRERVATEAKSAGLRAVVPPRALCTDNAAMVGAAAHQRLATDGPTPLSGGVTPNLALPGLR